MSTPRLQLNSSQISSGTQFETADGMLVTLKTFCVTKARGPVADRIRKALSKLPHDDVSQVNMAREDWGPLTFSQVDGIRLVPTDGVAVGSFSIVFK